MTIEELLDCSPEKLEAMSDKELLEYFAPFLNVTRPELAAKQEKTETREKVKSKSLDDKLNAAMLIMKQFGLEV